MKILIVGGSGFLSGTMARCAVRDGHEVWAITRGKRAMPDGVRAIVADRKDRPAFADAIASENQKWELVIDCIGMQAEDATQDVEVFADWAQHLVFISTDFLLSPINRPWKVDETYDQFNDTPYGTGKRAAEEVLLRYAATRGAKMVMTILRPCHIYGPGSLLGCLPLHGRDPELLARLKRSEPLKLVGGGFFLQQPIFAEDLWPIALSCLGNTRAHGEIYFTPGPDVIESRVFYQIIADYLKTPITIEEVAITDYLREHPEHKSFCAHRVYSVEKSLAHGIKIATTPIKVGLPIHVASIVG